MVGIPRMLKGQTLYVLDRGTPDARPDAELARKMAQEDRKILRVSYNDVDSMFKGNAGDPQIPAYYTELVRDVRDMIILKVLETGHSVVVDHFTGSEEELKSLREMVEGYHVRFEVLYPSIPEGENIFQETA